MSNEKDHVLLLLRHPVDRLSLVVTDEYWWHFSP